VDRKLIRYNTPKGSEERAAQAGVAIGANLVAQIVRRARRQRDCPRSVPAISPPAAHLHPPAPQELGWQAALFLKRSQMHAYRGACVCLYIVAAAAPETKICSFEQGQMSDVTATDLVCCKASSTG
jgi:hypothetical protein